VPVVFDLRMMRAHRIPVGLAAAGAIVFFAASSIFADGQFKRFPETISPDGAYVLAWAPTADPPQNTAELTEVPYEDQAFDGGQPEDVDNYLVDVAAHKIVATIPAFSYFSGPKWHKHRADLKIGWSPDARSALAIEDDRWRSDTVLWIEPATREIVDVLEQLKEAFLSVLRKKEPKLADSVMISFNEPVISADGLLIVKASGAIPKNEETAAYRLKFKVTGAGEKVQLHLQNARVIKEAPATSTYDPEAELNEVYPRLRAKLTEARRAALRDEQTRWLKLREEITDGDCKTTFTNHRIAELRVRLEPK
jgi:hypothetical protein